MAESPGVRRARALGLLEHPWTRRMLVIAGVAAVAVAAMSYYGVAPGSLRGGSGFGSSSSSTVTASTVAATPVSRPAGIDPCTILTAADVRAAAPGTYAAGRELLRPDGSICTFARLDAPGEVSVTLYDQALLDRAVAQDADLAYRDLRGLLEHTRSVAEVGSSTYVRSSGLGDVGYEITSTDAGRTDRLAVIDGDELVVLATSDLGVPIEAVRQWMRLALDRLPG